MMKTGTSSIWKKAFNSGLISGAVCLLVILVGLVGKFADDYVISGLITLGDVILFIPLIILAFSTLRSSSETKKANLAGASAVIGLISGFMITLLILLGQVVDLRVMFVKVSPALFDYLMRGVPFPLGALVPPLLFIVVGLLVFAFYLIPSRHRSAITMGLLWVIVFGTYAHQILIIVLSNPPLLPFSSQ
jgi:hypothetical protein